MEGNQENQEGDGLKQVTPLEIEKYNNSNGDQRIKQSSVQPLKEEFSIDTAFFTTLVTRAQDRTFCEDCDLIQSQGGDQFLMNGLKTHPENGIIGDESDRQSREAQFGNNRKDKHISKSFWRLLLDALEDETLKILMVAAAVSIIIETTTSDHPETAWIEGFAILVAVGVCSFVTAINDYQKEKQFQKLNSVADARKEVNVYRGGKLQVIHQSEVLVGDVMCIETGMEIPADGYLIQGTEITTDESAMTGETDPMHKENLKECLSKRKECEKEVLADPNGNHTHKVASPIVLSGTRCLSGEGKMVIIAVGKFSVLGKIKALLNQDDTTTPLQQKLSKIADDIGVFGLYSASLIVLVLLIRFAAEAIIKDKFEDSDLGRILKFFIIGITVIVVAIPEGLPLAVTLSLAFSVKQMLKDQNLVRKLQACETMGGANNICSDKTGTLTQNKMTLVSFWNDKMHQPETYESTIDISKYVPNAIFEQFMQCTACNCSAFLVPQESGSKTEIAILLFLQKCNIDFEAYKQKIQVIQKMPFSSSRKRMSMLLKVNGNSRLVVKGASEMVLSCCNKFLKPDGQIVNMDNGLMAQVESAIEEMANQALRTIVIAYKDCQNEDTNTKDEFGVYNVEKSGLVLLGVLGIKDILRQEVPNAISLCRKAGIKVRMVTGDNKITAKAIARECGLIQPNDTKSIVMEGAEFMQKTGGVVCKLCRTFHCDCPRNDEEAKKSGKEVRVDTIANAAAFDEIWPYLDVMARSRPEDKYALVTGLKERGNVVAVTGDGTNDAPALKKADVGFAMGIAGTEVAREAAAIILLDDNFNSIVKAVLWGRNIYDAIKKFLQFQLTVNVVAVSVVLLGAAIVRMDVLTAIQMLWLNLIMDTLASLALATEPPHERLLLRQPHNRDDYIVDRKMAKHIFGQAIYQLIIMMIVIFNGQNFLPEYPDGYDKFFNNDTTTIFTRGGKNWNYRIKYDSVNLDSNNKIIGGFMRSGREQLLSSADPDYEDILKEFGPSRHFTFVFNVFVVMTMFNFINARKIKDEINFLDGFFNNNLFFYIVFFIFFGQGILATHGGKPFRIYYQGDKGLTIEQWFICIGFGASVIVVNFFLKLIDESKIPLINKFGLKKAEEKVVDKQNDSINSKKYSVENQVKVDDGNL